MKKIRVYLFGMIVCMLLACRIFTASAAMDFSSVSDQEFLRYILNTKVSDWPFDESAFSDRYQEFRNTRFGAEYPWDSATDEEFEYLRDHQMIDYGKAGGTDSPFYKRLDRYNRENGVYDKWHQQEVDAFNAMLARKNKKMWEDSALTGNSDSHGLLTNRDESIYSRVESGIKIDGVDLGAEGITSKKPSGITKLIMEFLCWLVFSLAEQLDKILSTGGIALDNVIFGRVAGYGVKPAGETEYVSLFAFELVNGNPYGYVGAIIFQRIRSYIYMFMAVFCLFRLVCIAKGEDYAKMKMDFSAFVQNVLLSFSFIVMMPYIFDIYLYIRDIVLKAVTFGTLQDLLGTSGFLESFRNNAADADLNLIPNIIYLGAVILSLFVAGIYIAYAMSMMLHFILFPLVCLRGIADRNAYKEWSLESLGLTIMPLIDGILLIIPLTFSKMANGNLAFNLLSLVSCGMLLTARRQARRTLGIRDNGGLDVGAMATVMGLGHLARGIGSSVSRTAKRLGAAGGMMKDAKEDRNMADFYEQESAEGRVMAPNMGSRMPVGGVPADGSSVEAMQYSENLEKHANIGNFENMLFRGRLSNDTMAELYRKRAAQKRLGAFAQAAGAVGSGIGGLSGAAVGAGAGAFLGSGIQSFAIGTGLDAGSYIGGHVFEKGVLGASWMGTIPSPFKNIPAGKGGTAGTGTMSGEVELPDVPGPFSSDGGMSMRDTGKMETGSEHRPERVKIFLDAENGAIGKAYMGSLSNAARKMESPGAFTQDSDLNAAVNNVLNQMDSLLERARNGASPDELLRGNDGLERIRAGFDAAKVGKLRTEMCIDLTSTGAKFRKDVQTDRDAVDMMIYSATGKDSSLLRQNGRLMTERFDKGLGIDWKETEQRIRRECILHGWNENK